MSTALIPEVVPAVVPFRSAALDLNLRQKSFVDYYIEVKVGWKAAELAGYSGNMQTLSQIASENLKKPDIRAYYEERLAEMAVSSSEVLAELGDIARFDIKSAGKDSPIRALDKLKALELAGKYHRLFGERSDVDLDIDVSALANLLRAVCERARAMQQDQVGQGGPALSSQPIIDVTPIDHAPLLPPTITTTSD